MAYKAILSGGSDGEVYHNMQKWFSWKLGVLLLTLLVTVILLWSFHANRKEIVGTFSTGNGVSSDNLYISFFPKSEFLIYRQDMDILNGIYSIEELDGNVIARMTSNEKDKYIAIYNKRNSILFVRTNPFDIYELAKISDVPMIIGHKPDYSKTFDFEAYNGT